MSAPAMVTAYILAAGIGSRMRHPLPKSLLPVAGRSLIGHVVAALRRAGVRSMVAIIAPGQDALRADVRAHNPRAICAEQARPLGTAKALMTGRAARPRPPARQARALMIFGDTPLLTAASLRALMRARSPLAILGFTPRNPAHPYGRIAAQNGQAVRIIEYRNATAAERRLTLCNGGAMMCEEALLERLLPRITNRNRQGEYLLPDIVALAHAEGAPTQIIPATEDEVMGVDSLHGLAKAERLMQARLRAAALNAGLYMPVPEEVHFCSDTAYQGPAQIDPYVVLGPKVRIGRGCHIKSFCHIEGAVLEAGAVVGPFARLRPQSRMGKNSRIGNFVELKAARLGAGAKAAHLTYLGDAEIGADSNIGCGTVTCNYDGVRKHKTRIGKRVFVGSNSALIAPIQLGDGSSLGAGTIASRPVPKDALLLTRAPARLVPDWSKRARRAGRK